MFFFPDRTNRAAAPDRPRVYTCRLSTPSHLGSSALFKYNRRRQFWLYTKHLKESWRPKTGEFVSGSALRTCTTAGVRGLGPSYLNKASWYKASQQSLSSCSRAGKARHGYTSPSQLFVQHNNQEKTSSARHSGQWQTVTTVTSTSTILHWQKQYQHQDQYYLQSRT